MGVGAKTDKERQTQRGRQRETTDTERGIYTASDFGYLQMSTLWGQRKAEKAQPSHVLFLVLVLSSID